MTNDSIEGSDDQTFPGQAGEQKRSHQTYIDSYLKESLPADKVEENAEKLIETILSFYEPEKAPVQKLSRNEIHDRFEKEREAVRVGNYCAEDREALLADIEYRERLALVNELA